MSLKNKKILYVGLDYYRFPEEIVRELELLGAEVKFYPIKKKNLLVTLSSRLYKSLFTKIQDDYHLNILKENKKKYDYIFFIHIHQISIEILKKYKIQFKESIFILYYWDSIIQHDYTPYIRFFDKVLSFDPIDSENHSKIQYLPLFYTRDFHNLPLFDKELQNKILFIGTFNKVQRYTFVKKIVKYSNKNNILFTFYLDMKWTRYIRLIYENGLFLNWRYLKFGKTSFDKYLKLYKDHLYIIDLPNNTQSGLTMRVIETLGSGRKLITTNQSIKNENFYNPKSILIIENDLSQIKDFINNESKPIVSENIKKYFLPNWLQIIFEENKY